MQRDVLEKDIIGFERQKMPGFLIIWYFDKRVELETKYSKYITTKGICQVAFTLICTEIISVFRLVNILHEAKSNHEEIWKIAKDLRKK